MFARRHPYLFFLLISGSILSIFILSISFLIFLISDEERSFSGEQVGIIEIIGTISDSKLIIQNLKKFREQKAIKAIVLRVDSPGGAVGPSQEIYQEILRTREKKQVIVSMGTVAASGGYYVAAGADGIVANPGTITGSIGVIMGYTNFKNLLEKVGLTPVVIKSGTFKDIASPLRDMTGEENKMLQDLIRTIHNQFVKAIAEGRKMDISKVQSIADGRLITGEDAKALGLIDRIGNLEDAIAWAGELGGIQGKINAVYAKDEKLPFIKYLFSSSLKSMVEKVIQPQMSYEYRYQPGQ